MRNFFTLIGMFLSIQSLGQNVGIGTATPQEKLEVAGGIRVGTTPSFNPGTIRFNANKFEGFNDNYQWGVLGIPANALITVTDTTGFLRQGFSIYGLESRNVQSHYGLFPGKWETTLSTTGGTYFGGGAASVWTGAEIMVYYNNRVYRLNTSTNAWTQSSLNTVVGFQTRFGASAVWTGTEMIIFGGFNGTSTYKNGVRYNPASNTWSAITDAPVKRLNHSAVYRSNEMIVFGGDSLATASGCSGAGFSSNEVFKYNTLSNSWTAVTASGTIPSPRRDHVSVWTGTEMLVFGGSKTSDGTCNGFTQYLNDTYSFNPGTNTWTQKTPGPYMESLIGAWDGTGLRVWGSVMSDGYGYSIGMKYDPVWNAWADFPNEGAILSAGNTFAVAAGNLFYVIEGPRYQVFNPANGSSNAFGLPSRRIFYVLKKN